MLGLIHTGTEAAIAEDARRTQEASVDEKRMMF
jgi:hypothetical protein